LLEPTETADCSFWMKLATLDTFVVSALANDIVSAMVAVVTLYIAWEKNNFKFL
jgi:hypothetical protein